MAVAVFWDVFELRIKVFECLCADRCDADLARCARVHPTWTDLALNALWLGYPRTQGNYDNNRKRTEAIALLPRHRRQDYASRVSVLDFSELGGRLVHAMFDKLEFPRLKEVILYNVGNDGPEGFRFSKYLQPTLESLKLMDKSDDDDCNWLTASFLTDVAERCPDLKEVFLSAIYALFGSEDLARFFRTVRPQVTSLDFGESTTEVLTSDVLCILSDGGCLESLVFVPGEERLVDIEVHHLENFLGATKHPFPSLNT